METDVMETVSAVGEGVAANTLGLLHLDELKKLITWENVIKYSVAFITLVIFFGIYYTLKKIIKKKAESKFGLHTSIISQKILTYIFYICIGMYILSLFGINLKAIWGAAGVAGVAIGFAAQTSVSNIISGLFVLGEKTLKIGDFISIGGTMGTIDSISLLSIRIHTPDNQMIRIPNSSVINSNLMNFNSYENRRLVFDIPISYESDLNYVLETIAKVPAECPSVLTDPAPAIFYDGFGEAIQLKLAVWFKKENLIQVKNEVYPAIVKICRENNVSIPYNRIDVKLV